VRLEIGDVFEMPIRNGKRGYGVIVICKKLLYVIILKSLHAVRPAIEQLVGDDIAFVGWTMDALIYHREWTVFLRGYPSRADIPFLNWKVQLGGEMVTTDFAGQTFLGTIRANEVDLLEFQTSRSPMIFQHALEALHGIGEWRSEYLSMTPAYAFDRMTR
jgi:hypothetical protein